MVAEAATVAGVGSDEVGEGAPELPPLRSLADIHRDARSGGDLHRADLAWACHVAAMGLSASEIRDVITEARNLPKKGAYRP